MKKRKPIPLYIYRAHMSDVNKQPIYYVSHCPRESVSRMGSWVLIWDCWWSSPSWELYRGGNLVDNPALHMWANDNFIDWFIVPSRLELLVNTGFTVSRIRELLREAKVI